MRNRYVLQFVCYSPQIYSGLDKFFVLLTKKLHTRGVTPVFIYGETLDAVPQIRTDLEKAGAVVETMPENGKWTIIKSIRGFYRKYHPLLVDVHFVPFVKIYTALLSRLYGVKHITHIHSLIADLSPAEYVLRKGIIKRILLGVNYALLNKCGKVICVSKAIEKQYHEWAYGSKRNVKTMYLGTDLTPSKLTKQQAREKLGLPTKGVIITNISAIEYIKGIDIIIRAIAFLKRRGIDVLFAHIGGSRSNSQVNKDYAESLCLLSKEENVEEQIFWLGRRRDVQDIMSAFDIYVHPSRSEGLGCALMEASVAEVPLIGSRVGGIPEVVVDGENGFLVETENVEQLAKVLEQLSNNPELRSRLGNKAKEMVYNIFDMDNQTDKLIAEYQQ